MSFFAVGDEYSALVYAVRASIMRGGGLAAARAGV